MKFVLLVNVPVSKVIYIHVNKIRGSSKNKDVNAVLYGLPLDLRQYALGSSAVMSVSLQWTISTLCNIILIKLSAVNGTNFILMLIFKR